jgi:hypothetical protein
MRRTSPAPYLPTLRALLLAATAALTGFSHSRHQLARPLTRAAPSDSALSRAVTRAAFRENHPRGLTRPQQGHRLCNASTSRCYRENPGEHATALENPWGTGAWDGQAKFTSPPVPPERPPCPATRRRGSPASSRRTYLARSMPALQLSAPSLPMRAPRTAPASKYRAMLHRTTSAGSHNRCYVKRHGRPAMLRRTKCMRRSKNG